MLVSYKIRENGGLAVVDANRVPIGDLQNQEMSYSRFDHPPDDIAALVRIAQSTTLSIAECLGVSTKVNRWDIYGFHYFPEPQTFRGRVGFRILDFSEPGPPSIFPLNIAEPFCGDRSGILRTPCYCAGINRSYLDSVAGELFDISKVEFEVTRFPVHPDFSALLTRFVKEASSDEADAKLAAESLATLIIVDFLRTVWPKKLSRTLLAERSMNPGVLRARKAMLHDYASQLTIEDLAKIAHLSVAQFFSVFKKTPVRLRITFSRAYESMQLCFPSNEVAT